MEKRGIEDGEAGQEWGDRDGWMGGWGTEVVTDRDL